MNANTNWAAILSFVAAALALTAFLIDLSNNRFNLAVAAGGIFFAALGVSRLRKPGSQRQSQQQPGAGR